MRIKLSLLIFTMFLAFSCKEEEKEITSEIKNSEVIDLINSWNDSHNNKDLSAFSNVYADNVLYYGTDKKNNHIVLDKERLLNKYSDFKQVILNNSLEINDGENRKNVKFIKTVTFDSKQRDYPSYLVVSNIKGIWKITTESDMITDRNVSKKIDQKSTEEPKSEKEINNKLYGDFNGDGKKEYAWMEGPKMLNPDDYPDWEEEADMRADYCIGGCNSVVYFSDKTIVPLTITQSYGGSLENLGDLNNDGSDNIGIWTNGSYYNGGSSSLVIYDTENPWKPIVEPIYIRVANHDLTDVDIVKKISGNRLEIKESEWNEDNGWLLKTKIVTLK